MSMTMPIETTSSAMVTPEERFLRMEKLYHESPFLRPRFVRYNCPHEIAQAPGRQLEDEPVAGGGREAHFGRLSEDRGQAAPDRHGGLPSFHISAARRGIGLSPRGIAGRFLRGSGSLHWGSQRQDG